MKKAITTTLPNSPGVYLMKNAQGQIIYIGKAGSLKKRVSSYFQKTNDNKTAALMSEIKKIDYQKTDSILEATILEANLIKKYQPKYNIKAKDDRSFLYIAITKDEYPKILVKRGREICKNATNKSAERGSLRQVKAIFGPFTNHNMVRSILKLVRKIFPWSNCNPNANKPCFYYHLGQCPGICTGEISAYKYQRTISNLILFFKGRKQQVIKKLNKKMNKLSAQEKFEEATQLRNQLHYLQHIQDIELLKREEKPAWLTRVEGYDISNISGKQATGSMVVFGNGRPNKNEYRRFKIKTILSANDPAMLIEVIQRRFKHQEWPKPDLILVDGGKAQVGAIVKILKLLNLTVPIIGIAKGITRKKTNFIFGPIDINSKKFIIQNKNLFIQVRNEAHRFALNYHRKLRQQLTIIKK